MNYKLLWILTFMTTWSQIQAQLEVVDTTRQIQSEVFGDSMLVATYLDIADRLLFEKSDTSFHYAQMALSLSKTAKLKTGIIDAYATLGAVEHYRSDFEKSKEYYFLSIKQARIYKDTIGIIEGLTNIGGLHTDQRDLLKAIGTFEEAINTFENTYIDGYNATNLYNSIASLYSEMDSLNQSKLYLEKGLKFAEKSGCDLCKATFYINMGDHYLRAKNYEAAEPFFLKTLELYRKTDDAETGFYGHINMAALGTATKNYINAQMHLDEAKGMTKDNGLPYYFTILSLEQGKIYAGNEDYVNADKEFDKAMNWAQENKMGSLVKEIGELHYPIQARLNDYEGAYQSLLAFKTESDSLASVSTSIAMKNLTEKIEKEQASHEKALSRQQLIAQQNRQKFIWASILGTLIAGLGSLWFLFYRQKSKTREAALERDKFSSQLEVKNKEITSKVMYLARKNELIKSISDRLVTNQRNLSTSNRKIVQEVINELKSGEDDDIWKEFEMRFQEVHDSFYKKLKAEFPALSQNDLRMCAFLRLNLSSKDIAGITFQSLGSIEVARSRLRKKLGIGNTSVNLTQFIAEF